MTDRASISTAEDYRLWQLRELVTGRTWEVPARVPFLYVRPLWRRNVVE